MGTKHSFFSIFDGIEGSECSKLFEDRLYNLIITDPEYPKDPKQAILNAFKNAESEF